MRVVFESSHVRGAFSRGRLTFGISREDERLGATTWDEFAFIVPRDFHTHNDAVAAALMTLVGPRYDEVEFNFSISSSCAELLGRFYRGVRVSPVDPAAEARRPGARLALNFSGGLDSTAVRAILEHLLGEDGFAVVTSEYGRRFAFEANGYAPYRRDISCLTNLREKHLDRDGRFNFCIPLLFADYLDLGSVTTGHALFTANDDLDALIDGGEPHFLHLDLVANAGGLAEVHLSRGIHTRALYTMLVRLAPERAEQALRASARAGTRKHYMRAWVLGSAFADAGLPVPDYLRDLPPPTPLYVLGESIGADVTLLSYVKSEGIEKVGALCPELREHDLAFLDDFSMDFINRYHQRYLALVPQPLRDQTLAFLDQCGIAPCTPADLEELAVIRRFFAEIDVYPFDQPNQ